MHHAAVGDRIEQADLLLMLEEVAHILRYLRDVFDEEQADLVVGSHGGTIPTAPQEWPGDFRHRRG